MKETVFFRGLGVTILLIGFCECVNVMKINKIAGAIILVSCLMCSLLSFIMANLLENKRREKVHVENEEIKRRKNSKIK